VSNGIQQILFVTGRKSTIENHFDHDPELARALTAAHKQDLLKELDFEALKANFFTPASGSRKVSATPSCALRTSPERSHFWWPWAIPFWPARGVARRRPHGGRLPLQARQLRIAVEEVPREETSHYGIVQPEDGVDDVFRIVNLVEKPPRKMRPVTWPSPAAISSRR